MPLSKSEARGSASPGAAGLPSVAVLPHARVPGASRLSDEVPPLEVVSWRRAFCEPWSTDAHLVCYLVEPLSGAMPRCRKSVLPEVRAAGADLVARVLGVDLDNPGHVPWTPALWSSFLASLARAREASPVADQAALLYTTRAGARMIYALPEPLPVDVAELACRALLRELSRAGLQPDPRCHDWTREFRLPFVTRDGRPTWEDDFLEVEDRPDRRLDLDLLRVEELAGDGSPRSWDAAEGADRADQPDPAEAYELLARSAEWHKAAKARLRGRDCFPCLFEGRELASRGRRDATLHSYVGQAVAMLSGLPGSTVELVYALFLAPVELLEPDSGTPDWTRALWRSLTRCWALEGAKRDEVVVARRAAVEDGLNAAQRALEGVRSWCRDERLSGGDQEAYDWLSEHLIACSGNRYHVMRPDGLYDQMPVDKAHLVARVRELRMDPLITLEEPSPSGKGTRPVSSQTLIDRHGTIVARVEGLVGPPGATIRDPGTERSTLLLRMFCRREDLAPSYHPGVDSWLRAICGPSYELVCRWIGLALAFEEGPICALSLSGPPGAGKKMLVRGLAECVSTQVAADHREFGNFQSLLLSTPFLVIDEGFPSLSSSGVLDPADAFRRLVAGDPIVVEEKFRERVVVRNPLRVIFTANNLEVVRSLTGKRDLSPEDRMALAQRLQHVDLSPASGQWLRERGGRRFTARKGERWITGDSGEPSDHVVARHFLWLWERRPEVPEGARLLVEGDPHAPLVRQMATRSGSAPEVIEALVRMVESAKPTDGCVLRGDRVLVTTSAVVDFFRSFLAQSSRRDLSPRQVASVLKGLVARESSISVQESTYAGQKTKRRARWFEVDAAALLEEAVEHGYFCQKLAASVQRSAGPGAIQVEVERASRQWEQGLAPGAKRD